ncbi:MAG: FtsW/RodA/SpoVE family cell cycle protein, partial [Spongiibacteraceae bacterium]
MNHSDFLRQLPHDTHSLRGQRSISQRLRVDLPLLILLLILAIVGLFVLYSASDASMAAVLRQGRFLSVAFVAMVLVAQIHAEQLKRLAPAAFIACLLLLLGVEFFGTGAKGAQRWLSIGGFRFQPSELAKLVMPMTVAWYLASHALPPNFRHIVTSFAIIFAPVLLVVLQPDLGTSILIATSGVFVLFLSGVSWSFILACFSVLALSIYPLWQFVLHDYQRQRVLTLLNPESDMLGAGWNIIQSKTAIGSGGLDGKS